MNRKRTWKKKVIVPLYIIFIISIILIIKNLVIDSIENKEIKDSAKIIENNKNNERCTKISELKKEWPDIIGWLEIEGTNINYPVCQTNNNEYYLTHTYNKEENKNGSLFLDMNNAINENERNLIIYGHRNKYGLMFEDLIKYQYEEFWKNHATIRFTTEMNDEQYMIFAVVKTKVYYQNENGVFKYYNFAKINNEDEYYKYIDEMKKLSLYKTNVEPEKKEPLLTLSTCEYSQKNGRFVVVAKKITSNSESEE